MKLYKKSNGSKCYTAYANIEVDPRQGLNQISILNERLQKKTKYNINLIMDLMVRFQAYTQIDKYNRLVVKECILNEPDVFNALMRACN